MSKNMKWVVGIVVGIIILLGLLHLSVNWLIPTIIKMHSGIAG